VTVRQFSFVDPYWSAAAMVANAVPISLPKKLADLI